MTVLFGATLQQYFRKVLSTQECPVRALLSLGLRLSAQIACRNRAIHDDIIELSKRLRRADGEVFHDEPTAPCCHRFRGFRCPAANSDYPTNCTERHPGANRVHSPRKGLRGFGSSESCELRGMGTLDRRKVHKDGRVARGRGRHVRPRVEFEYSKPGPHRLDPFPCPPGHSRFAYG